MIKWLGRQNNVKRLALLVALMLLLASLAGCFARKDAAEDPNGSDASKTEDKLPPPTPSPTPTHVVEPIVTPRPIPSDIVVITAAPSTTPLTLDPIDKAVKKVTYRVLASQTLGITLKVPETWVDISTPGDDTTVILQEPDSEVWDTPGILRITVLHPATNMVREDAKDTINNARDSLKAQFPNIEMSTLGDNNKMLGETGYYYNYRIPPANENSFAIRGRIFAVALNRLNVLMEIRMPGRYSQDFLNIFTDIRTSAKIYGSD